MTPLALSRFKLSEIERIADDWLRPRPPLRPLLELREDESGYRLEADLGALSPERLDLRVSSHALVVEGAYEAPPLWNGFGTCLLGPSPRELRFSRRFPLRGASVDAAQARLSDGKLVVEIPKGDLGAGQNFAFRRLDL